MFVTQIGRLSRSIPSFRGKTRLAGIALAPILRGKGHRVVVPLTAPGGGVLLCNLDDWIPWNVFLHGRYHIEARHEEVMLREAASARVVFDVGANIGYYTVQFGRILRGRGSVHAFEPMAYQHEVLLENLRLNGLGNVVANKMIVSDAAGQRRIYFGGMENTGSSSVEVATGRYEDVACQSIDAYCASAGIEAIDLIKIDVEGHEPSVLKGMEKLLREGRVGRLFIEVQEERLAAGGSSAAEILSRLEGHGYLPHSIGTGSIRAFEAGRDESLVLFKKPA